MQVWLKSDVLYVKPSSPERIAFIFLYPSGMTEMECAA